MARYLIWLVSAAALIVSVIIVLPALLPVVQFRATVEQMDTIGDDVWQIAISGNPVIRIRAGRNRSSRAHEIAARLDQALSADISAAEIRAATIGDYQVVMVNESIVATIDNENAKANASTTVALAQRWAESIRAVSVRERQRGLREKILSARGFLLQPPVFAALIAVFGASILGPLFNSLIAERQLDVQARQQRLSRQIILASSLAENLDRLLATHKLEFELSQRKVALEQDQTQATFVVRAQYSQTIAAWIRAQEALTAARAAHTAAGSEAELYFGPATQQAIAQFRELYNKKEDTFNVEPNDPLFTAAGQILHAIATEIGRQV